MPRLSKIGAACLAAFGYTQGTSTITANYLVVAGGGGGGDGYGGGGGAGGLLLGITSLNFTQNYVVTVGAGGTGSSSNALRGSQGSNSIFSSFATAIGGGGGGSSPDVSSANAIGGDGGSAGGGAANATGGTVTTAGGTGTSGQGNNGGSGITNSTTYRSAGGGGGSSAVGGSGTTGATGSGGNGTASSISGSSVTYAGGGGGGGFGTTRGLGGNGGGGAGGLASSTAPVSGIANLGGGGGGGADVSTFNGAGGGSGVVIVSYASPTQLFGGGTVTYSGGNWIHTFTTSGTLVPATTFTANYLLVAGGGAGGGGIVTGSGGGGGGAGGIVSGTGLTFDTNSNYIITVGAGGSGTVGIQGTNGGTSNISSIVTSTGGGGGGNSTYTGLNGGSGGGGYKAGAGTGVAGQGNAGAQSITGSSGSGGGGASTAGTSSNVSPVALGNGGNGSASSLSGASVIYAGGGGGGRYNVETGGAGAGGTGGGGGGGSAAAGTAGTAGLGGGGGGGAGGSGAAYAGGAGGSGIVIISYAGAQRMAGGTVTFVGGNTIHTFTSSGYLSALKLVNNSLRFKSSTSSSLTRTPTVAGNRKTWTWSGWVKRGALGVTHGLFAANFNTTGGLHYFYFTTNDNLVTYIELSAGIKTLWSTNAVFRDPAAWYHIVIAFDTTQAAVANMCKMYVNGVLQSATTSNVSATYISQNADGWINNTTAHYIGSGQSSYGYYFDGYMTEINFVNGQALTPSSFGGYNSFGVWQPTQYLGSYGTNGFYLPFTNNASSTTIGYDFSPNQNNWTANGFTLTPTTSVNYDSMTDVPTLTSETAANYPVFNPLVIAGGTTTYSNANLATSTVFATTYGKPLATFGITSGKFYWEVTIIAVGSAAVVGVGDGSAPSATTGLGGAAGELSYLSSTGQKYTNNVASAYGATYTTNDVIGVAYDADAGSITFYKNGASQGIITGLSGLKFPAVGATGASASQYAINFGQQPFIGTIPVGFVRLNTFNM